jgi:hypothetical protein
MKVKFSFIGAAAMMLMLSGPVGAQTAADGSFKVAQGATCQSWYSMCSQRCKTRLPDDKNCTSDHCSPKLSICKQTGCWQEGQQYGGGKTCGLSK